MKEATVARPVLDSLSSQGAPDPIVEPEPKGQTGRERDEDNQGQAADGHAGDDIAVAIKDFNALFSVRKATAEPMSCQWRRSLTRIGGFAGPSSVRDVDSGRFGVARGRGPKGAVADGGLPLVLAPVQDAGCLPEIADVIGIKLHYPTPRAELPGGNRGTFRRWSCL